MKEGETCPDFSLPSTEGEFRLSEKLGKNRYIVLYFYPRDDTPGCTAEACSFRDMGLRSTESVPTGLRGIENS